MLLGKVGVEDLVGRHALFKADRGGCPKHRPRQDAPTFRAVRGADGRHEWARLRPGSQ